MTEDVFYFHDEHMRLRRAVRKGRKGVIFRGYVKTAEGVFHPEIVVSVNGKVERVNCECGVKKKACKHLIMLLDRICEVRKVEVNLPLKEVLEKNVNKYKLQKVSFSETYNIKGKKLIISRVGNQTVVVSIKGKKILQIFCSCDDFQRRGVKEGEVCLHIASLLGSLQTL
ncbi:MAG: hypothetical protein B6U95_00300 [Thermofilum sp. ex4484_82]|nr:MAG: hypothetical protein B6U95_00300 [Thermofilum sp. ex4484_82]OYT40055.1 MAG: hypothetical protein B6U96_00300 [Archaeoglobales archaeon ex4484_92]